MWEMDTAYQLFSTRHSNPGGLAVKQENCSIPVEPLAIVHIIEKFPNSRSTFEYQN